MSGMTKGMVAVYALWVSGGSWRSTCAKKTAFLAARDGMRTALSSLVMATAAGTVYLCARVR
jgi:hypothetical protein